MTITTLLNLLVISRHHYTWSRSIWNIWILGMRFSLTRTPATRAAAAEIEVTISYWRSGRKVNALVAGTLLNLCNLRTIGFVLQVMRNYASLPGNNSRISTCKT